MAEKMANSIGRELRYFEYKLRKKQQTSKKKKNKNDAGSGGQMAWSDAPTTDDFKFTPKSEELQKAMPGSKGEEELQIQVALAMSREEEQERARQSDSDKVRLEMALKESINDAKPPPQPSLLDMSLSAPKPATTPVPSLGSGNPFGGATNDPWGATPAPAATAPTFDPFAPQVQSSVSEQPIYATSTKGFTAQNQNDAWGVPQTTAPSAPVSQDPWGGAQTAFNPQPLATSAFPSTQSTDAWGNTAPATSLFGSQSQNAVPTTSLFDSQPQNAFTTTQNPFPTTQSTFPATQNAFPVSQSAFPSTQDAFSTPAPAQSAFPTSQNGAWGNSDPFLGTQPAKIDPFAELSANRPTQTIQDGFTTSTMLSAPPFDPLKEFDSLHIGAGNPEPAPVILSRDYGNGKSVSKDLFPLSGVLEPEPAAQSTQQNGFSTTVTAAPPKKETDLFLGENSSLVNLDSGWKTYQVPYCSKPLGSVTHNPFQQTGPTKSLNEMKQHPGF